MSFASRAVSRASRDRSLTYGTPRRRETVEESICQIMSSPCRTLLLT